MKTITKNYNLKPYNSFGVDVSAKYFISINSTKELEEVLSINKYPNTFILGGGSNILFTKDLDALCLHINNKDIKVVEETKEDVIIECAAGENWHSFVLWCLQNNYGGIENLSLIPGNVGASPVQNIGAYGVELKDVFLSCKTLNVENGLSRTFTKEDCQFGYRNSIFKTTLKGKYIITSITIKLQKPNYHRTNYSYGSIKEILSSENPTIREVSDAIIQIRKSKLPNPTELGNAGSFFKNPIVNLAHYNTLKIQYPDIPCYNESNDKVKIPAAWLIEKSDLKGMRYKNAGVHTNQPLVLVNHNNAKGSEIVELARIVQEKVATNFEIDLECEVTIF